MIELVLSVCLVADPTRCKDVGLQYAENMTPFQCAMRAQPEIAKWSEANPNWVVKRFKCGRPTKGV